MDGLIWRLSEDAVERYDPKAHGWSEHRGPYRDTFPEVFDRRMVHWREFWVRGGERLIVEWAGPLALKAVLLNGEEITGKLTDAAFEAAWMREG